LHNTALSYC